MPDPKKNVVRKIHDQSSLAALTEKQEADLMAWFVKENITYSEAKKRIKERFGIHVCKTALHGFWHRFCADAASQRSPGSAVSRKQFRQPTAIDSLSIEQKAELKKWFLTETITFQEAMDRIAQRFGKKINFHPVRNFWHREIAPLLLDGVNQAAPENSPATVELTFKKGAQVIARTTQRISIVPPILKNPA